MLNVRFAQGGMCTVHVNADRVTESSEELKCLYSKTTTVLSE